VYEELSAAGDLPFRITGYLSSDDTMIAPFLEAGPRAGRGGELFRSSARILRGRIPRREERRAHRRLRGRSREPGHSHAIPRQPLPADPPLARQRFPDRRARDRGRGRPRGSRRFRETRRRHPAPGPRPRVEHAQIVAAEDIARFAKLGVIPSMQFIHCTSDMPWVEDRLGAERVAGAYAWRSLIAAGSRIPGGSDFPVESINPFLGIHAAVTRQDLAGRPEGGWRGEQRLTLGEALGAFTSDAAYAAHAEDEAGSLAPGNLADFIVLSDDIFSMNPAEIPLIRVLATVLGGEIVYRRTPSSSDPAAFSEESSKGEHPSRRGESSQAPAAVCRIRRRTKRS